MNTLLIINTLPDEYVSRYVSWRITGSLLMGTEKEEGEG